MQDYTAVQSHTAITKFVIITGAQTYLYRVTLGLKTRAMPFSKLG